MAVIWGLDLHEMKWSKFKSSYMWNNEYHRRRTRFIVYQLAMILCVISESLGTAVLSDFIKERKQAKSMSPLIKFYVRDFIGIASFNIFVGIYVATIFGSAFFFDLLWPERKESQAVRLAWRICSVIACIVTLACALAYTYILAVKGVRITGPSAQDFRSELRNLKGPALKYHQNTRAVVSVCLLWPGTVATFASTYLLWESLDHNAEHGPKSTHARDGDQAEKAINEQTASTAESKTEETVAEQQGQVVQQVEEGNDASKTTTTKQESVV